jgi:uncharacterized protein (TIGR02001 family)
MPGVRAALCASLPLLCSTALAQTGGSIAIVSDERYRGVSLSDEQPTARLTISHDAAGGWYGGASLAGVTLDPPRRQWQLLAYLGHSARLSERLAAEAGVIGVHFGADGRYDYHEWFAGLGGDRWNTRLYISPSYFGSGVNTAYAELNVGIPLGRRTRFTAHLGALARVGGGASTDSERVHADARLGVALARDPWQLELALVGGGDAGLYPVAYRHEHGVLTLAATCAF